MEPLFSLTWASLCLAVLVVVIVLWQRLKALEERLNRLDPGTSGQTTVKPGGLPCPAPTTTPPIAAGANSTSGPPPLPTPPPLPFTQPPSTPSPATDPWSGLRRLGLLPPSELQGEFALGSWWAIRIAGALALAAIGFLAVWLNLRSTLPAWLRLGEIVALGAFGLWFGDRLARTRRDLGRVVFAVGLAVFPFAAWAAHGLERMRVLATPAEAAAWQFITALAVGAVALLRQDRLIGQLAVVFAAIAALISVPAGSTPLSVGLEAGGIALLGGILFARGGWATCGALGLLSSVIALIWLRLERVDASGVASAGQIGAVITFLALWVADRFSPDESTSGSTPRNALLGASFLAPATLAIWVAEGGDTPHALAAGLAALAAVAVGLTELRHRRLAAELLLASALFFAAAAVAWKLAPDLVWLAWVLAAALAQFLRSRTEIALLSWASKLLTAVGTVAFLRAAPTEIGAGLLATATVGALTAWRLRMTTPDTALASFGKFVDLTALAILTAFVHGQLTPAQQPWAWVVVLPSAWLFGQIELLWSLVPTILWTHAAILLAEPNGEFAAGRGWMLLWALSLSAGNTWLVRGIERWTSPIAGLARVCAALAAATLVFKSLDLALVFPPNADDWRTPLLWCLGAGLTAGLATGLRRLTPGPFGPLAAMLTFWPIFLFLNAEGQDSPPTTAMIPLWLLGQAIALAGFARLRPDEKALSPTLTALLTTVVGAATGGIVFATLGALDGTQVSLSWALAAGLTFTLGLLLDARAYRLLGLLGLLVATGHVVLFDIHDLIGRIVACAAIAAAFFGVAWLYGRFVKKTPAP